MMFVLEVLESSLVSPAVELVFFCNVLDDRGSKGASSLATTGAEVCGAIFCEPGAAERPITIPMANATTAQEIETMAGFTRSLYTMNLFMFKRT